MEILLKQHRIHEPYSTVEWITDYKTFSMLI